VLKVRKFTAIRDWHSSEYYGKVSTADLQGHFVHSCYGKISGQILDQIPIVKPTRCTNVANLFYLE